MVGAGGVDSRACKRACLPAVKAVGGVPNNAAQASSYLPGCAVACMHACERVPICASAPGGAAQSLAGATCPSVPSIGVRMRARVIAHVQARTHTACVMRGCMTHSLVISGTKQVYTWPAHLDERGVLPEAQLVFGVAVAGQDLLFVAVPLQGAHLQAGRGGRGHSRGAAPALRPACVRVHAAFPWPWGPSWGDGPAARRYTRNYLDAQERDGRWERAMMVGARTRPGRAAPAPLPPAAPTWEPVAMWLSMAPVWVFQKRMHLQRVSSGETFVGQRSGQGAT